MKAKTQMIVRACDVESGTSFIEAEHAHLSDFEDRALRECETLMRDGDVDETEVDTVQRFIDLVRERRTRFDFGIRARKARAAGILK